MIFRSYVKILLLLYRSLHMESATANRVFLFGKNVPQVIAIRNCDGERMGYPKL